MADVNWNEKSHIKLLKWHYPTVRADKGRGIFPLFSSPPRGIWQLMSPHPREFAIQGKKMLMPGGQPGEGLGAAGIDWCITVYNLQSKAAINELKM